MKAAAAPVQRLRASWWLARKGQELCDGFSTKMKLLCTNSSYQRKKIWMGIRCDWWGVVFCRLSSPGVGAFPGSPGRFVLFLASSVSLWMLLRIRRPQQTTFNTKTWTTPKRAKSAFLSSSSSWVEGLGGPWDPSFTGSAREGSNRIEPSLPTAHMAAQRTTRSPRGLTVLIEVSLATSTCHWETPWCPLHDCPADISLLEKYR